MALGSMLNALGSQSTNAGTAFTRATAVALATKDSAGTSTSSPASMPAAFSAHSSAVVPFVTATQCFASWYSAHAFSNWFTLDFSGLFLYPPRHQMPLFSTSSRSFSSFLLKIGHGFPSGPRTAFSPPPIASLAIFLSPLSSLSALTTYDACIQADEMI